ncbi:MAG: CBS domain-containing protein, partial [Opitutales bacterium]
LVAYVIATKLRPVPIYDALLLQDGISLKKLPAYRGEQDWRNLPVSTIMTHDCQTVQGALNASENLESLRENGRKHHAYPIVAEESTQLLLGMITHHELERMAERQETVPIKKWADEHPVVPIHPDQSIRDAANTLVVKDVLQAPVVSRKNPEKLLGIVTLHDIARQQNAIEETLVR